MVLKIQEIRELIRLIDQSSINDFSFEQDGTKIEMKKQTGQTEVRMVAPAQEVVAAPAPVQEAPAVQQVQQVAEKQEKQQAEPANAAEEKKEAAGDHQIVSPMVGTFYASPSPDADAYVKVGDSVSKDSVVCIVEAMKLFNEIEAEVDGEIVEVLVENGQLVEYGQPLFSVKTK